MKKPEMKNKRKIFTLLISTIFVTIFSVCLFFQIKNNGGNNQNFDKPNGSNVHLNQVYKSTMLFELDQDTKTATFKGIKEEPGKDETTLNIPETTFDDNGKEYTVTKVSLPDPVDGSVAKAVSKYLNFTALIIPDTVTQIDMAALAGFASLEYLRTPLVGQVIDDTSSTDVIKDNPFGSMFSYPTSTDGAKLECDISDPGNDLYTYSNKERSFKFESLAKPGYQPRESWYEVHWYSSKAFSTSQTIFYIPRNLREVIVTKDTSLCNRAFNDCGPIEKITLPDSMKDLNGQYIFYGMNKRELIDKAGWYVEDYSSTPKTGLKEINLPKACGGLGVGCLGSNGFLTNVVLPEGLQDISEGCFYNCPNITTIDMPSTVKKISDGAFSKCSKLTDIKIFKTHKNYISGKEFGFNLPDVVEEIGVSAFAECMKFTSITINSAETNEKPNGIYLQSIGASAFAGCENITSLTIPFIGKSVGGRKIDSTTGKYIGSKETCLGWVFGGGSSGISYWDNFGITNDSGVGNVNTNCQYGLNQYDVAHFWIPTKLSTLTITNETQVCRGALQGLSNLTSISLNKEVTYIAPSSLKGDIYLKSLTIPFVGEGIESEYLHNIGAIFGTEEISGKTYAALQGGVTYYLPTSLNTVEVTNARIVYTNAFQNMTKLENCIIDYVDSNQRLQREIFHNNPKLADLTLPFIGYADNSYGSENWWWWYTGRTHDSISWIFSTKKGSADDYWYSPYYDTVYDKDNPNSPRWDERYIPASLKKVTITNESVIEGYAMHGLTKVEEIIISDKTTRISQGAFRYCNSLKSITLPFVGTYRNELGTSKYENTFISIFSKGYSQNSDVVSNIYGSSYIPSSLRTITISNKNTKIATAAFMNLSNVETITFESGNPVDSLGNYAFYGCENLKKLNWDDRQFLTVGDYAFYNCKVINGNDITKLLAYTEDGALMSNIIGSYAFAGTNLVSTETSPIDFNSFREIGDYAFYNCAQIEYADVSGSVFEYFGEGIFASCLYLRTVVIGENTSAYLFKDCISLEGTIDLQGAQHKIPEGMFMNCKSITFDDIRFAQGTETIEANAFNGCESLGRFTFDEKTKFIGTGAFSNCYRLAPITIPRGVETIEADAFNNNGDIDEFYFWVYYAQKNWPQGWVNNWNCDYLVYVLGTADPDIFTYEYSTDLGGYLITGMVAGNTLIGSVQFPEYKNGIKIKGIDDSQNQNNTLKISSQLITRAVIPAGYQRLNDGLFGLKTDVVKHTVEIFLEHDDETAKKYFGSDSTDWNFLGQGIVYTSEYWQHIADIDEPTVGLYVNKFDFEIDSASTQYVTYDGTAKTIKLKSVKKHGYVYGDYDINIPVDVFDLTYTDNIFAGTAHATTKINQVNLAKYNSGRTSTNVGFVNGGTEVDLKYSEDELIGSLTLSFTIGKKRITVYPSATSYETTYNETTFYYLTQFNNSNVDGISNSSFTMSGRLRPNSLNAGVYRAVDEKNGDFVWEYIYVRKNGTDVTSNFDIHIGDLTVTINPKEIIAGFKNGEWSTGTWQQGALLFFSYIGKQISPEVLAYDLEGNRVSLADSYLHVNLKTVAPIYPSYDKDTNKAFDNSSVSLMDVSMSGTKNYVLRYYDGSVLTRNDSNQPSGKNEFNIDGSRVQNFEQEYWVVKGKIIINYRNLDYVIPMHATNWELTDFKKTYNYSSSNYFTITGLGDASRIQGRLYNIGIGNDPANAKGTYSYKTNTIEIEQQSYLDKTGNTKQAPFLIIRETAQGDVVDNDYYDIELSCEIKINYNQFDLTYYIDGVKQYPVNGTDVSGNSIKKIKFEADGDNHTFSVSDDRFTDITDNPDSYVITYLVGEGKVEQSNPYIFKDVRTHAVAVRVTATNFDTFYQNLYIEVVKGSVVISSLTKEYDATPVSVKDNLVKYDKHYQTITCEVYEKYDSISGNWVELSSAPYQIGRYRVHVKVEYPKNLDEKYIFFNNYDNTIEFEITKRVVEIDITKDTDNGSKYYDGNVKEWIIDPTYSDMYSQIQSRLLNGDVLTGTFETNSANEGNYSNGKIVWTVKYTVNNIYTNFDNTSNYDIILVGNYEIKKLDIQYVATDYIGEYDGNYHSIAVQVSGSVPNYQILYSGENRQTLNPLNPSYIDCKSSPFDSQDLEYKVKFEISAPHYNTIKDERIVKITRKTINVTVSDEKYPWDSQEHSPQIPVVVPSYAKIYYKWQLNEEASQPSMPTSWDDANNNWSLDVPKFVDPGSYRIYMLFVFDNYVAVMKDMLFTIGDYKPIENTEVTVSGISGTYNGKYDSNNQWIEKEYSISVSTTLNKDVTTIYYSTVPEALNDLSHSSWSIDNPKFTQVGEYTVYVKVVSNGRKPYTSSAKVEILKDQLPENAFSTVDVNVVYDGKLHTIELKNEDAILNKYYDSYIGYSVDPNAYNYKIDSAYGKDINDYSYKNAGTYTIYVAAICPNYESVYKKATLTITKANLDGIVEVDENIFQYSAKPINVKDLFVTLTDSTHNPILDDEGHKRSMYHDGVVISHFYPASLAFDNMTLVEDKTQLITAPTELGYYYIEITYRETNNCLTTTVSGFFKIAPRQLKLIYEKSNEYTGYEQMPIVSVDSGTTDKISVIAIEKDGRSVIDIGEYTIQVSLNMLSGKRSNYVLDISEFTYKITPVKIYIGEVSIDDDVQGDNKYSATGVGVIHLDYDGLPVSLTSTDLLNDPKYADLIAKGLVRGNIRTGDIISIDLESFYTTAGQKALYIYYDDVIKRSSFFRKAEHHVYDASGNDVSQNYEFVIGVEVSKWYAPFEIPEIPDAVYTYDEQKHYPNVPNMTTNIQTPITIPGNPNIYITKDETITDNTNWTSTTSISTMGVSTVGIYTYTIKVSGTGREPAYAKLRLIIEQATLDIEIDDFVETYDAQEHQVTYDVKNFAIAKCGTPELRYYKTSDISLDKLDEFYQNYSKTSDVYGMGEAYMKNASDYYAVVYYPEALNFKASYEIKEVTIKRKRLSLALGTSNLIEEVRDYNGKKVTINLGNKVTFQESDLLPGHSLSTMLKTIPSISTISASAGLYETHRRLLKDGTYDNDDSGFEFDYPIYDENDNEVQANYYPYVNPECKVKINKIYLNQNTFKVENLIREYDMTGAKPKVTTEADGYLTYLVFKTDSSYNTNLNVLDSDFVGIYDEKKAQTSVEKASSNVGYYRVVVYVTNSTNYYDLETIESFNVGNVEIQPRNVEVHWENLEQNFNNTLLRPDAYILDPTGGKIILDTYFENGVDVVNAIRSGSVIVTAKFKDGDSNKDNYCLVNYEQLFEIKPIEITIDVEADTQYTNSVWSRYVTLDELKSQLDPELFNSITLSNKMGGTSHPNDGFISTKFETPGMYNEKYLFNFDMVVRDKTTGVDISSGFTWNVKNAVIIRSNELQYKWNDLTFKYDGRSHTLWEAIELMNPTTNDGIVGKFANLLKDLDSNNNLIYTSNVPTFKNVGTYTFVFNITKPGYTDHAVYQGNQLSVEQNYMVQSGYHVINITIEQADSYLAFEAKDLNKKYDGFAVSKDTLGTSGGYNGSAADLVYKFYMGSNASGTPMTTLPVDTGTYTVRVTSRADQDTSDKNYTQLDVVKTFTISPADLELNFIAKDADPFDVEVNKEMLNKPLKIEQTGVPSTIPYIKNLASGDVLSYVVTTGNTNVTRGHHIAKTKQVYDQTLLSDNNRLMTFTITADDGTVYSIQLRITCNGNNKIFNYDFTVNMDLYVHFAYIDAIIKDTSVKYDGLAHAGVAEVLPCTSKLNPQVETKLGDLTIYYSTTGLENDYQTTSITYTDPTKKGGEKIYYKMVDTGGQCHEDLYGSYYLEITKLERTYAGGIINNNKTYDGLPWGILDQKSGLYLPDNGNGQSNNYNLTLEQVKINGALTTKPDDYLREKVSILYHNKSYSGSSLTAINQGTYEYTLTIPESTYYKETIITGEFKIEKAIIKIEGTYLTTYNGTFVDYSDFTTTNASGITLKINGVMIPASLVLHGTVRSAKGNVGTYSGSDIVNGLHWVTTDNNSDYYITNNGDDDTENYSVDVSKLNIEITLAQMVSEKTETAVEYDGELHDITLVMKTPAIGYKLSYSLTNEDVNDDTKWSYTPISEQKVGTYECYIRVEANNYLTQSYHATLKIVKAKGTLTIPELSREYSTEVLEPGNFQTNNTEVDRKNYTIRYEVYDSGTDTFIDMTYNSLPFTLSDGTVVNERRPINVGKYRITVIIPESGSFREVEASKEFIISAATFSMTWPTTSFVYNANRQVPEPLFIGEAINKDIELGKLRYTISSVSTSDPSYTASINAGSYEAKAVLDCRNYSFDASSAKCLYQILRQQAVVKANAKLHDTNEVKRIGSKATYDAKTPIDSSGKLLDGYFTISGLQTNDAGLSDYVRSGVYFQTVERTVSGIPSYIGSYLYNSTTDVPSAFAKNFTVNGSPNLSEFKILGDGGVDATMNYNLTFDLNIEIIYANLDYIIVYDKDAYGQDTGGVYTYDGRSYSYSLDVKLSNPDSTYKVFFFDTTTNTWKEQTEANKPKFSKVPVDSKGAPILDSNGMSIPYTFKIKVVANEADLDKVSSSTVSIRINQAPSNFGISFNGNIGKVYDGEEIQKPTITYKDMDKLAGRISYTYYVMEKDGVTYTPISYNPSKAGNYKLVITPNNAGEYTNYTAITDKTNKLEYLFTIQKRPIAFNLSSFDQSKIIKVFDGLHLSIEISNANFVYVGNPTLPAIVNGDTAYGRLQTISADVGAYSGFNTANPGLIQWGSIGNGGFEIQTDKDDCYDIDWSTLVLEILKANIDVEVSNIDVMYDGNPHVQTVAGGQIIFNSPSASYDYATNHPNGYRIYYGLSTANLSGLLNEINAGNEDSLDLTKYKFSENWLDVAQTEITPHPVPIYVVITCKNYNPWISNNANPPTINIKAKSATLPVDKDGNPISPGGDSGYGKGDEGKPGQGNSPGGNGSSKPGTGDDGETSLFANLQYDGNIEFNGNPYMNPSIKWQRNKPYYYNQNYANVQSYEDAQHVTYYYYGTDFTKSDYCITQTINGNKVGPVNDNGSNVPTSAGEYIFVLKIDTYDNVEEQYFYQYFKIKPKDVSLEWGPETNIENMLDAKGNPVLDNKGNPVKQVVFEYNGKDLLPEAWYTDINGSKINVNVAQSEVYAGDYVATYFSDNSPGANNYNKVGNISIHYVIKKKSVTDIIWPNDLTVEYGKEIELKDSIGNTYIIDKYTGKILKIIDSTGLPVAGFNVKDYPFTFNFSDTIYANLDDRNPDAGSIIDVTIKLDDPANYMWASRSNVNNDGDSTTNNTESNNLVISYTVVPRNLYDDDEWDYTIIMPNGSNQPIFEYTGNEIRPYVKVKLTRKDDPTVEHYLICSENEITDANGNVFADPNSPNLRYDYLISFEDNTDPTDDPNKVSNPKLAKIILSTLKADGTNTNFVFGYEKDVNTGADTTTAVKIIKEFRIQDPYPTTIQLTADSIMKFVKVGYDSSTEDETILGFDPKHDGINYDQDGNDTNLINRDALLEADSKNNNSQNRDSIYLGRIHHETELSKYIEQIANDKNRIIVYNQKGELVDRKYYDTSIFTTQDECFNNCKTDFLYIGSTWTIELYDEVIVDADSSSPEGYKYRGTVDADNKVFTPDTANAIDSIQTLIFGDGDGNGYVNGTDKNNAMKYSDQRLRPDTLGVVYYALNVYYLKAYETSSVAIILNSVSVNLIMKCADATSGTENDFNSAYMLQE